MVFRWVFLFRYGQAVEHHPAEAGEAAAAGGAGGTGGAEPSQLYTTVEGLSWMVVTVLLALLYWMALTRIC